MLQVVPSGGAYLTLLEHFMPVFGDSPHKPRRPPWSIDRDLRWWRERLGRPCVERDIPGLSVLTDLHASSDASSSLELVSSLEIHGERGSSKATGKVTNEILLGPKPSGSNYSSELFSQRYRQARMSNYMETTKSLSKDGSEDIAKTNKLTMSSNTSTNFKKTQDVSFMQDTFKGKKIPPTVLLEEFIPKDVFSLPPFSKSTTPRFLCLVSEEEVCRASGKARAGSVVKPLKDEDLQEEDETLDDVARELQQHAQIWDY